MNDIFGFSSMQNDYESRRVAQHNEGELFISTARVTDSIKPYETAVRHPAYHNNKILIVETYDTKKEAEVGHMRWVAAMKTTPLPPYLKDVSQAGVKQLCEIFGADDDDSIFPYEGGIE